MHHGTCHSLSVRPSRSNQKLKSAALSSLSAPRASLQRNQGAAHMRGSKPPTARMCAAAGAQPASTAVPARTRRAFRRPLRGAQRCWRCAAAWCPARAEGLSAHVCPHSGGVVDCDTTLQLDLRTSMLISRICRTDCVGDFVCEVKLGRVSPEVNCTHRPRRESL